MSRARRRTPGEMGGRGRGIPAGLAGRLREPAVTGWARLHATESATTLRAADSAMLLTDGPFVDSKEYLAGVILIEAENLDAALAVAEGMLGETRAGTAIEVRPVLEALFRGTAAP